MRIFPGLRHTLRTMLFRQRADSETLEELADHLARQTRKHIDAGMSTVDAERLARIELGGVQRWRDETAEARPGSLLGGLLGDCRFALRTLRKRPGFAFVAILSLGAGLGASSAIFSVIDGALLRPLPFPQPDRLATVSLRMPVRATQTVVDMVWSYPKYTMFRDRQTVFSALALYSSETLTIDERDGAERISGEAVGSAYFALLGARPAMGRTFVASEDSVGAGASVVVISDAFWRTRLGMDPHVIGRTVDVNGAKRSIVGVMLPGVQGLSGDAQLWLPITGARSAASLAEPAAHNIAMIGRLASGVSFDAALQAVEALGKRIDETFPADDGHWSAGIRAFDDVRVAPAVRRALQLLAGAVALVITMVAVNLLTLFFTRGLARREELAVRVAIGAGRARIVRQVVTEALVVTALGAAASIGVGVIAFRFLSGRLPMSLPTSGVQTELTRVSFAQTGFGIRSILFTVAMAALIGVMMGVATALRSTPRHLAEALRQTGSAGSSTRGRALLVAMQIALAVVLLIVAGLTVDSLRRVLRVPLGYRPDGLFSTRITLDRQRLQSTSPQLTWANIQRHVSSIPGVTQTAYATCAPIGMHCDGTSVAPAGHSLAMHAAYLEVSPGYFTTIGTPLVRGRELETADITNNDAVMIINREAARRIWGADDPLTTPAMFGDHARRVIGIVEDARYEDPERSPEPAIYLPAVGLARGVLFIRTKRAGTPIAPDVRSAIRLAGRGNAMGDIRELTDRLEGATARNRLSASIVTTFAITALLLAGLGVYGSLALAVMQRSREFAIRRALGAGRGSLVRMVVSQAAKLGVLGGIVGLALGGVVGRGVSGLLYEARPLAPGVYLASVGLLGAAVAVASLVPSLRSMRADPRDAMRAD